MKVRPGAAIQGVGVAVCIPRTWHVHALGHPVCGVHGRLVPEQAGTADLHGHPRHGRALERASVSFATAVSSWSTAMLAATTALRRTRLPGPIGAVVLGGGVLAIDSLLADLGEKRDAAKAADTERVAESAD